MHGNRTPWAIRSDGTATRVDGRSTLRRRQRRGDRDSRAAEATAFEEYVGRRTASFRRSLVVVVVLAFVGVLAVSSLLALRQYRHAQQAARTDLRTRAAITATLVDVAVTGDIRTLEAIAASPPFRTLDRPAMHAYLLGVGRSTGNTFNGGYGWVDPSGLAVVSTTAPASARPIDVSGRTYFRRVMATGEPYVSGGLISHRTHHAVIAIAVPTRMNGRLSGVLVGSIQIKTVANEKSELELGIQGLQIVDGSGRMIFGGLRPVPNTTLLARIRRGSNGVVSGTPGLDGGGNDVVAYAAMPVPRWSLVIDRPVSTVDAAARRSLYLELGSLVATILIVLAVLWFVLRRSRRHRELDVARASAWGDLTRALGAATTQEAVATALLSALASSFPYSFVVVTFETFDRDRRIRIAQSPTLARFDVDGAALDELARLSMLRRMSVPVERVPALAGLSAGRRLRAVQFLPIESPEGETLGGMALVRTTERGVLDPGSEWVLLVSFASQAAQALERTRWAAHEHDLAMRLQRSLLPEALPESAALGLAGHYRAGGEGVEVGGDWYDAVRRPDGIVQLSVGDVVGRGVEAAALMGRYRNAFRAYAYDCVSPGEIMRRMVRHADDEETMVTMVCVSFDPYLGEIAYSSAGHPPPLLVDDATATATRLVDAGAPPLGVATPSAIREARLAVGEKATLVLYSDGLIERRGRNIDDGIDALSRVVARAPAAPLEEILAAVTAELGAPGDDVALLVARVTGAPMPFDVEFPSDPAELPVVRRRLRAWLERRHVDLADEQDVLLAVGEACNNAVEHAYADDYGSIHVVVDEDGGMLRATVRDDGTWREGEENGDRGRGIMIMEALMNVTEIDSTESGTTVVLERLLHGSNGAVPIR